MTQKYDKEFKVNAVKIYLSNHKSIEQISKYLGISRASLGHWIKQYKAEGERSFPGSGHVIEGELKALRRELYLVR